MSEEFRARLEEVTGRPVTGVSIDLDDFARFKEEYVDPRGMIDDAKMLEYYLSYRWLDLGPDDTYIDVAAQDCPFAFFVESRFGASAYRQDLHYLQRGIHGRDIGGNAARIPLPGGSVTKISLHNSLEHFAGRNDTRFIREAQRLLGPGGKLLVVPLFIREDYSTVRDDGWIDEAGEKHLWGVGARFARWYDPLRFRTRILDKAPLLEVDLYHLDNAAAVDPAVYPYLAIFTRTV